MNVSQLAAYQVPGEAFKMRKRSVIPFFNRQRALKQRNLHIDSTAHAQPFGKRTWETTTRCGLRSTVTATVTVTDCGTEPNQPAAILPNTTYVGTPLPCLPTPDVPSPPTDIWHAPEAHPSSTNCTCQKSPTSTHELEHHPSTVLNPAPARGPDPLTDITEIRKRAAAWNRVAYYTSADPAQATGFSFLANLGDPRQSGTFD